MIKSEVFPWKLPSAIAPKKVEPTYGGELGQLLVSSENSRQFNLDAGESPFGPPKEYREIRQRLELSGAFYESGIVYKEVDVSRGKFHIRERFSIPNPDDPKHPIPLGSDASIFASAGGSYEILERIPRMFVSRGVIHDFGIGPHFPGINNFIMGYRNVSQAEGVIKYSPIEPSLDNSPLSDGLNIALDLRREPLHGRVVYEKDQAEFSTKRSRASFSKVVFYLCNPGTPLGDKVELDQIEELARLSDKNGDLLIVDEAFGDCIDDSESAIHLTQRYPVIVTRTLSKMLAMPGERLGYAVMRADIGEVYQSVLRVFDMPGPSQLIFNEMTNPEITSPFLKDKRAETLEIKKTFVEGLKEIGVDVLPTSDETIIFTASFKHSHDWKKMAERGIKVTRGSKFVKTHSEMSDKKGRFTIPKSLEDVQEVLQNIREILTP